MGMLMTLEFTRTFVCRSLSILENIIRGIGTLNKECYYLLTCCSSIRVKAIWSSVEHFSVLLHNHFCVNLSATEAFYVS